MRALSKEKVSRYVSERGFKLLSDYVPSQKLYLSCSQGHLFRASWSNFKHRKSGCAKCKSEKSARLQKKPYKDIVAFAEKNGQKILTTEEEYLSNKSRKANYLKVSCKCGVSYKTQRTIFKGRCLGCMDPVQRATKLKTSLDQVLETIKKRGYEPLFSKYENSKTKISVSCSKHGSFEIRLNDLQQGHGCPSCGHTVSIAEKEIGEKLESKGLLIIKNDRSVLDGLELDIFIPSLNLAIEFCGNKWHTEEFGKEKDYHYKKYKECLLKGVSLITVFENEWLANKEAILTSLLAKAKIPTNKTYARKTKAVEIDVRLASEFANKHHIQGYKGVALTAFALFDQDEIIGCAILARHPRDSSQIVLSRLCFGGTFVSGGFAKLLKKCKEWSSSRGYKTLISWSDNRWSSGSVYQKNGFYLKRELPPDYFYVLNGKKILKKQSATKKHLLKMGGSGSTEKEMALSLGYYRMWDCGKKTWFLDL